jgi:membrane-associated phospholipid phosphatase
MQQVVHGPIEVVVGLSFGIGWGILLMFIPHKDDVSIHDNSKVSSFTDNVLFRRIGFLILFIVYTD